MPKKTINSASSNKELLDLIGRVNNKIRSYYKNDMLGSDTEVVAENFVGRVQNLLSFESGKFSNTLDLKKKGNSYYIPKNQKSVDWLRDTLGKQELARANQKIKDPNYVAGKSIAEQLDDLRTFSETVKKTQKDLEDPNKASYSDAVIIHPRKGASKEERAAVKELNRQAAVNEIIARAEHVYTESISDAIDKLYEDRVKNADIIAALNSHEKWTGELLEEVNLRAEGIVIEDIF